MLSGVLFYSFELLVQTSLNFLVQITIHTELHGHLSHHYGHFRLVDLVSTANLTIFSDHLPLVYQI